MTRSPATGPTPAEAARRPPLAGAHPLGTMPRCPRSRVVSDFQPAGDQPAAIEALTRGIEGGDRFQALLGITGSGKSATTAWTIEKVQRTTLVLEPNKSLAAQLAGELRGFFPDNRVEYFVSYYDYYQPEAYLPSSDTYIEKDSSINDEIDRLRHSTTASLLTRKDVIVVASVSCIYGLGSPDEYRDQILMLSPGEVHDQRSMLSRLVAMHYERNDANLVRGRFRVRGDTIEVHPAYEEYAVRIELFGDEVERLSRFDVLTGELLGDLDELLIFPPAITSPGTSARVAPSPPSRSSSVSASASWNRRASCSRPNGCGCAPSTISRCSRSSAAATVSRTTAATWTDVSPASLLTRLLDYFPDDWLLVIDESHVTVPQLHGQFAGDRSRKEVLVEHGFRLPSALDNRPLRFEELEARINQCIFLSATPAEYEISVSEPGGRADRAADRPRRPRGGHQADQGPDRRSDRGDQHHDRPRRARACHDPHEEDGRGPCRLPARDGLEGPLPALEHRHDRKDRDRPGPPLRRVRRPRGHQSPPRGSRSARGSRSSRSSTPTRRDSSGPRRPSSRRWATRRATSLAGWSSTQT